MKKKQEEVLLSKKTKKAIDKLNQIVHDYINIFDSNKKEVKEIEKSLKVIVNKIKKELGYN